MRNCIWFVISDRESGLQGLQRRAVAKGIVTGFNRLSKLPNCSDVVISFWIGRNLSEQATFDCSIVCAAVYIQHLISVSRFDRVLCLLFLFVVICIV